MNSERETTSNLKNVEVRERQKLSYQGGWKFLCRHEVKIFVSIRMWMGIILGGVAKKVIVCVELKGSFSYKMW